jgi:hypothetical protein
MADSLFAALAATGSSEQSPGAADVADRKEQPTPDAAVGDTAAQGQVPEKAVVGEQRGADQALPEDDITKDPRVRRLQASYDKQISELRKTIAELQARNPDAAQRDALSREYAALEAQYEEAVNKGAAKEASQLGIQLSKIAERIFELDLAEKAQAFGLDVQAVRSDAIAARDRGEIYDPATLETFLLRKAYEQVRHGVVTREQELAEREKQLAEREAKLEETIQEAVRRQVAEQLIALGLTDMTSIQQRKPGKSDLSKARSLYEALTLMTEAES